MPPRMYMQTIQFVTYDFYSKSLTFETRHVSGRRYHFIITKSQFLALDDIIMLIEEGLRYGYYPLDQNMWLSYKANNVSIYKETLECGRIKFTFEHFEDYKRYTHSRLRSLLRLNRQVARRKRMHDGGASVTNHQRSLSVAMQPSHQSSTSKRRCWNEREAAPRSTDNVKLPPDDKTRSILSERHGTTPRRRTDSIISSATMDTNLSSPATLRLDSSDESLESE